MSDRQIHSKPWRLTLIRLPGLECSRVWAFAAEVVHEMNLGQYILEKCADHAKMEKA